MQIGNMCAIRISNHNPSARRDFIAIPFYNYITVEIKRRTKLSKRFVGSGWAHSARKNTTDVELEKHSLSDL